MFDMNQFAANNQYEESEAENGPVSETRIKKVEAQKRVKLDEEDQRDINDLLHDAYFSLSSEKILKKVTELMNNSKDANEKISILEFSMEKLLKLADLVEMQIESDVLENRKERFELSASRNFFIRFFNSNVLNQIGQLEPFYKQKTEKTLARFLTGVLNTKSDHDIRRYLSRPENNSSLQGLLGSYYEDIAVNGSLNAAQEEDFLGLLGALQKHDRSDKNPSIDLADNAITRFIGIKPLPKLTDNKYLTEAAIKDTLKKSGFIEKEVDFPARKVVEYIARLSNNMDKKN